jgi:hypothetical protein
MIMKIPTTQIVEMKDLGTQVIVDPNRYAPILHVTGFASVEQAATWLRDKFADWWRSYQQHRPS